MVSLGHSRLHSGVAALAVLGSGCLYHANKDALARSAQSDFREAKLGASVDEELAYSKEMLKAEMAAVQREVEATRDEALARLLDAPWGGRPAHDGAACLPEVSSLAAGTVQCELNRLIRRVGGTPVGAEAQVPAEALRDLRTAAV